MSINPLTVDVDEFVTHAREIMRDNNIQSLPAVKGGKYQGMVTMQDIINVTSTKSDVTLNGYVRWEASTVTGSTSLAKAAREILSTDEGRMPVLDGDGHVTGILSMVDIFKGIEELDLPDVPVRDIMTRKVIVCEPHDDISRVWRNMTEFGISGFPVVKPDQEVIGMITREDITRRGYVRFERENEFSQKAVQYRADDYVHAGYHGRRDGRLQESRPHLHGAPDRTAAGPEGWKAVGHRRPIRHSFAMQEAGLR